MAKTKTKKPKKTAQPSTDKLCNCATNSPSRIPSEGTRYRSYSVQLYCDPNRWEQALSHAEHYAYILHDKDTSAKHYHLLLRFQNARTPSSLRKLFDLDGLTEDTTINLQILEEKNAAFAYLTHSTPKAIEEGKYQYDPSAVVCDDVTYWRDTKEAGEEDFLEDLLNPDYSARNMAVKYGRDYIRNYRRYEDFRAVVIADEAREKAKHQRRILAETLEAEGIDCTDRTGYDVALSYLFLHFFQLHENSSHQEKCTELLEYVQRVSSDLRSLCREELHK